MNKEMEAALEADGEKLRQQTGEDHGPWWISEAAPEQTVDCVTCEGRGYTIHHISVYEQGCGFSHDDTDERQCPECGGIGFFICDVVADHRK